MPRVGPGGSSYNDWAGAVYPDTLGPSVLPAGADTLEPSDAPPSA